MWKERRSRVSDVFACEERQAKGTESLSGDTDRMQRHDPSGVVRCRQIDTVDSPENGRPGDRLREHPLSGAHDRVRVDNDGRRWPILSPGGERIGCEYVKMLKRSEPVDARVGRVYCNV